MDIKERKWTDYIEEGLCIHYNQVRLAKTGNPYAILGSQDECIAAEEIKQQSKIIYKHLYDMGMIK